MYLTTDKQSKLLPSFTAALLFLTQLFTAGVAQSPCSNVASYSKASKDTLAYGEKNKERMSVALRDYGSPSPSWPTDDTWTKPEQERYRRLAKTDTHQGHQGQTG